jgi:phosphohistidine phosphatase
MKIYLIRHGVAREPASADFEADSQRPLTIEGRDTITRIAHALKKLDVRPDLILSSPYVRAEQTAAILAKEFDLQKRLVLSELLAPEGKAEEIISMIVEKALVDELFIVGHLPCLALLASLLAASNFDLAINLKKGGVCCLLADDLRLEPHAALEWLLTPKILLKA